MSKRLDLLNGNIASTLTKLALPLMGMSFLQMAYNLTDMFWIGKLGAGSVAAVGTVGILTWLSTGLHSLAQTGGQVLVAQNLGAKNYEQASKYAHSAIFISIIINFILGFSFSFLSTQVIGVFKLNDPEVIALAETYLKVCGGFILFMLMSKLLSGLITTTGNSKTPLIATTIGLVFNMILDPILIFGWCGFPKLGVLGAAIATVLAQIIVFIVLVLYIIKDKHLFSNIKWISAPSKTIEILRLSFPTALQATLYPLISIYISRLVSSFSDTAVAVQRVGSQVESISWLTTEGFAVAVNSFIAQNYGASNINRAKRGFYEAGKILAGVGIGATVLLVGFATPIISTFLSEADAIEMGRDYLVIIGFSQIFMCFEILSISALNAFSKTKLPAVISSIFMALRIPLASFLCTTSLGLNGIWWSIAISTFFKGTLLFACIVIYLSKGLKEKPVE